MIKECTERYDFMLGVVPPRLWLAKGFVVGEPVDHRKCKINREHRTHLRSFLPCLRQNLRRRPDDRRRIRSVQGGGLAMSNRLLMEQVLHDLLPDLMALHQATKHQRTKLRIEEYFKRILA
jgi:hypothetical protein